MLGPAPESFSEPRERETPAPDVVTSLDAVPEQRSAPPSPPRPRPPSLDEVWAWLRRHRVPLALAFGAAAVGALLATGVTERSQLLEARSTVRLLAAMTWPHGGWSSGQPIPLGVVVVNAGPEPVTVTAARLADARAELRLAEAETVPAGCTRHLSATLVPDCASTRGPSGLFLTVATTDGATREVPPGALGGDLGMPVSAVAGFCDTTSFEGIPVWRTAVDDDGRLTLQLRNTTGQPVELTVGAPPGTRIVGEPELPATLPTDRSTVVRLAVEVDRCTSAAQRADAGGQLDFQVDGETGVVMPDQLTVAGWFAQEVARACG